jgi:hypothetical protein
MISEHNIRDALAVRRIESREVEVYIDGKKVDTLKVIGALKPGMTLDTDAINDALQGREVVDMFFTGEIVNVVTKPEGK